MSTTLVKQLSVLADALPPCPAIYRQVVGAIQEEKPASAIGALLARDVSTTARILRVVNSAQFGLSRTICNPVEAVSILGTRTVRDIVLSSSITSHCSRGAEAIGFSIEEFTSFSINVAQLAARVAAMESTDDTLREQAFTAGVMHAVGRLVLMNHDPDEYLTAQAVSNVDSIPLWAAEKQIFGVNYAEVGAFVLDRWNLPVPVVVAVGFHHKPHVQQSKAFCPLAAVHAAWGMHTYEGLDEDYLKSIGKLERLPVWQKELLSKPVG